MFLLKFILMGRSIWFSRKSVDRAFGSDRLLRMIRGSSWSSSEELEECPDPGTLRVLLEQEGEMNTVGVVGEGPLLLPGLDSTELCRLGDSDVSAE